MTSISLMAAGLMERLNELQEEHGLDPFVVMEDNVPNEAFILSAPDHDWKLGMETLVRDGANREAKPMSQKKRRIRDRQRGKFNKSKRGAK